MFKQFEKEQPICCKILNKMIKNNTFLHAYLFETNGYDKGYDFALEFAKQILCSNKKNKNCENCSQCKMIDENNFPEIKIIDDEDTWIKKEKLVNLQNEFSKKPILTEKKVYIINHAEKLNASSSNSILKFLEEPSDYIVAILVTNNRYQLLETIISRCQIISLNGQVDLSNIDCNDAVKRFGQVITNNKDTYDEFCNNETNKEKIDAIVKFVNYYEKNGISIILYMHKYWNKIFTDKNSYNIGLNMLLYYYKDILNVKFERKIEIFNQYKNDIILIAEKNTVQELTNKIEIINESIDNLNYNANLNLLMDKMIIKMEGVVKNANSRSFT